MDTDAEDVTVRPLPRWLEPVLTVLAFLFPLVVATTDGGGSYVYVGLLLLSLVYGRGWSALDSWEKRVLLGFSAGFLAMLLSMLNTADLHEGGKWIERYLRLALTLPIYLMFRRALRPSATSSD